MPLHFTEVTLISGPKRRNAHDRRHTNWVTTPDEEARQAADAIDFYRVLFSHPSVEAITWWDFSDRGAWLGAPAGLVRADMTPKPAFTALRKLITHEWWTGPIQARTDGRGRLTFSGFLGEYLVEAKGLAGPFALTRPGTSAMNVRLVHSVGVGGAPPDVTELQ